MAVRRLRLRTDAWVRRTADARAPSIVLALLSALIGGLLCSAAPAAQQDPLSARINAVLADKRLSRATVGVHVVALGSGRVLYSRKGAGKLIVASNQKIITAATALSELGAEYEFETTLFGRGELLVEQETLDGDLILRGGADPTLGSSLAQEDPFEQFDRWARGLAAAGIRRVSGDLAVDDTFLDRQHVHPDWPRRQLWRHYCAPVCGIPFMDNCVTVTVKPGAAVGQPALVLLSPDVPILKVANYCKTASTRHAIWFDREAGSATIKVGGRIRTSSRGYSGRVTVPEPSLFAGEAFAAALLRGGVRLEGSVRLLSTSDLTDRQGWRRLASRRVPITQVLAPMLKHSHNVYAEHVIKTVGAECGGEGSWRAGLRRAEKLLERLHFLPDEFELADGSGLSRKNRMTPAALCAVLADMDRSGLRETFRGLFATSGVDGTLARRLREKPYKNSIHAKTGYLYGVGAMSGYAETPGGLRVAFSILINDFKHKEGNVAMKQIEDRIVRAIVDHAQ